MRDHALFPEWSSCPLDIGQLALHSVGVAARAIEKSVTLHDKNLRVQADHHLIPAAFSSLDLMRVNGAVTESWSAYSGFFRAADGWVRLHGNYPHHRRSIEVALGISKPEYIQDCLRDLTSQSAETIIRDNGGIASMVRKPGEWAEHPHAIETEMTSWCQALTTGERTRIFSAGRADLPLQGVRVLDLTRVIAGPTCTQLLACLGAEVLRVDPPNTPELENQYISNAMGKRSAVFNFSENRSAVDDLLNGADVVVVGYRPGSLDKFGLAPAELIDQYPHLVVASLSAWGEEGPLGKAPGFDSVVQAATGISWLCERQTSDGETIPGALPAQALDHSTGFMMVAEIINLLVAGSAGIVRANLLGAAKALLSFPRVQPSPHDASSHPLMLNIDSDYGEVQLPPPPITLGERFLQAPIKAYASSGARWRPRR